MSGYTLAAIFLLGAPALKEKPPEPPNGEWDLVQMVYMGGLPMKPKGENDYVRLRFTSTSRTAVNSQFPGPSTARVVFSQAGGVLRLDVYQHEDEAERGIWKVDIDVLTICQGLPGEPRPTDFTCPRGSKRVLMVFRRIREE